MWPLLDHTALVVDPASASALIGRNGTGKSSLLKILGCDAAASTTALSGGSRELKHGLCVAGTGSSHRARNRVSTPIAQGLGRASRSLLIGLSRSDPESGARRRNGGPGPHVGIADAARGTARLAPQLAHRAGAGATRAGRATRTSTSLSGGMLQARGAGPGAGRPSRTLLLLDEPTNHLDLDGIALAGGRC
jgi:ABC-type hemin transport system ATPase subunit